MPRTLFIDADACPVTRESIDCARRAGVAVVIAGNSTQNLERHIRRDDPRDVDFLSRERKTSVAFRSAKVAFSRSFAERKTTIKNRSMLSIVKCLG